MTFPDNTKVQRKKEAIYLGCTLIKGSKVGREIQRRIGDCMETLKKLDLFWLHSSCPVGFKILVHNSIIRSKLLYSLNTTNITAADRKKLDVFQLKGLRKILHLKTTAVDKNNSNQKVYELARSALTNEGWKNIKLELFSETYHRQRKVLLGRILKRKREDPVRKITINEDSFLFRTIKKRRVGRPRHKWIDEIAGQVWTEQREKRIEAGLTGEYDDSKDEHVAFIRSVLEKT